MFNSEAIEYLQMQVEMLQKDLAREQQSRWDLERRLDSIAKKLGYKWVPNPDQGKWEEKDD